jgi:hypothetical protein
MGERGVETAFHHPMILVRARGGSKVQVVAPCDVMAGGDASAIEWSPMLWALRGRRRYRAYAALTPASVLQGRDDRLFHITESICEQLFEGGVLGPRGLKRWIEALNRRIDFCEARGIVYRHLVIPDGHAIYADAIPFAPRLSEERPLMQILRAGGAPLSERVVYPLNALIAGRAKFETSHKHDVHCTGYGYFLCYRELIKSLPNIDLTHLAEESELQTREAFTAGDVARGAGLPGRRVEYHDAPHPRIKAIIKGTSYRINQVDVLESEYTDLPRLLMFRTSHSSHMFSYLMRHFSRVAAVATTSCHYELIESERPDVVIGEIPERYFAPGPPSASDADFAWPPQDTDQLFETATGYALPLPEGKAEPAPT